MSGSLIVPHSLDSEGKYLPRDQGRVEDEKSLLHHPGTMTTLSFPWNESAAYFLTIKLASCSIYVLYYEP